MREVGVNIIPTSQMRNLLASLSNLPKVTQLVSGITRRETRSNIVSSPNPYTTRSLEYGDSRSS